jgi:hypothetical protein
MDDTLGHFEEIAIFLTGLRKGLGNKMTEEYSFKVLDLFPNFFRPGIINILKNIKKKKRKDSLIKVLIYTNNMGPHSWTVFIKKYLEIKVGGKLFDHIISGYKPDTNINKRTTHYKTVPDILRCTGLNKKTRFLFIDDQQHDRMVHNKVTYMKIHAYNYGIPFKTLVDKYMNSNLINILPKKERETFKFFILNYLSAGLIGYNYKVTKQEISKKDLEEEHRLKKLIDTFVKNKNTRRKRKKTRQRRTKRRRSN